MSRGSKFPMNDELVKLDIHVKNPQNERSKYKNDKTWHYTLKSENLGIFLQKPLRRQETKTNN